MSENLPDTNVGNIEYIRKPDAVDALDRIFDNVPMELTTEILRLRRELRGLHAADVVEVVRCKDCKHWQTDWNPSIPDRHYCAVMDSMMKADDFCSYGEKREE